MRERKKDNRLPASFSAFNLSLVFSIIKGFLQSSSSSFGVNSFALYLILNFSISSSSLTIYKNIYHFIK